ncbi:MAG: zinc-dependent alcohol dehydrogenase family protein [Armatimonadetes bacterium]|nr:zinc-dependent alcohol dehydrogenase family protein [Armatimonadota bacterium]
MKTRAAILTEMGLPEPYAQSRPLEIGEVDLDPPGQGEVIVEIRAAGLCHSDLSTVNGVRPRPVPLTLGHEASGVVVELGPGVDDLRVGDVVVLSYVPMCGQCRCCLDGRPALCEPGNAANVQGTLLSGERRIHHRGETLHHHLGVSAFAQYAVVSRRSVVKIDRIVPFEVAALFGCAVLTGVGAVVNTAKVPPGATVAVVGLGGVGLNAVLGAVLRGARRIVGIDLLEDKLDLARQLGATDAVAASDPDCVAHVRDLTGGGVDFAFETAGSVRALDVAYRVTRRGGTTVTAGVSHPDHQFSFPHISLVGEERTLKGSYMGSCIPPRDIPRFLDLHLRGLLPVEKLMSERVGLDGLNAALDRLAEGHTVRQIVVP